jgi:hypothetical protein
MEIKIMGESGTMISDVGSNRSSGRVATNLMENINLHFHNTHY